MFASVLLAALLAEAALRLVFPKYSDAAAGRLQPDAMRIYSPLANTRSSSVHPETRLPHPYHTNNLGLRQHRNFSDADVVSATTVGVFGDSFVHMGNLDAPHVFTEPLDYLLNLDDNFTVLNFGVNGYGPAQSYFTYASFLAKEDLDYVLFVYYGGNDLADLVGNGLLYLDDSGRLRQREARGAAWWVPFASKLHLTYLALDVTGRFAPYIASAAASLQAEHVRWLRPDLSADLVDRGLDVFGQLIDRWKGEVERSGGRFFVALLPTQPDFPRVRPLLDEAGVDVVDLNACFERRDGWQWRRRDWSESPYFLQGDGHWNELGNRLAAVCLNDRLRREAGLPAMTKASLETALAEYYAAFEPVAGTRESERTGHPAGEEIRHKYQAFGGVEAPSMTTLPDELALNSDWNAYFDGPGLLFVADDCDAEDAEPRIFAHATPVDASILPPNKSYGDLLAYKWHRVAGNCDSMSMPMPPYPVSHLLVGQGDSATGMLWSGEIFLDRAAFEKTLEDMLSAAGEPVIESVMDVHVHRGRIFYVSDDCQRTDGRTPFFLHITPMRTADLPQPRIEAGYDNWDFHQVGVTLGARCVVRWHLPDYPIRHIRTGQYTRGMDTDELRLEELWVGEAAVGG